MSKYHSLTKNEVLTRIEEIEELVREGSLDISNVRSLNAEKARLLKEIKRREGEISKAIPDPTKIPHLFKNVELTKPASKELAEYMNYCLEHFPDALRYIHNASQEYVDYNGVKPLNYAQWKRKLMKDLKGIL